MSDPVQPPPSPRDPASEKAHDAPPAVDLNALADRVLAFLATSTNETLGACLVGLGVSTYLVLGRVGLVLMGVVGGVVLHATWEGSAHTNHADHTGPRGSNPAARRHELGIDVARRLLDWRDARPAGQDQRDDDRSDLDLRLYAGKALDFSDFQPETAAALTELTDAVIRDYVKYAGTALHMYLPLF